VASDGCEATEITIRFPRNGLEVRPLNATILVDRNKMNRLDAEFGSEVADYLKDETDKGGAMAFKQPAEVLINGTKRYHFLFFPENLQHGTNSCWITLEDPQKILEESSIDTEFNRISAREAYSKIWSKLNSDLILKGLKFNIGDQKFVNRSDALHIKIARDVFGKKEEAVERVLDGTFSISFDSLNCYEALWKLNDKLNLTSWADESGFLVIGSQSDNGKHHLASQMDPRVWRFSDPRIRHPENEIKKVVMNGDMIDDPEFINEEELETFLSEGSYQIGSKELIPQGIAERKDIDEGKTIVAKPVGIKKNSLEFMAHQALVNEIQDQNAGSISIDPQLSGKEFSDYEKLRIGDFIQLTPSENECVDFADNEIYEVDGMKHNFESGRWSIDLDVIENPDDSIETSFRYFDAVAEEALTEEEVYG
jgi:hypothetical protein